ncbi:MAG: haloacid dehalogenase type II [Aquincola sp.]|nr:haloacid dehalogenase type II [Aquincola sp.]MDH4287521.1 haloacid dehalogenase type II [Aquincola sp.]MDH5328877.1 haloacid dehalogenase type II [Aquincola sp.]
MHRPKAVLFDAFGTLFDVYSVSHVAEQLFPGRGEKLALLWRDKQIEYTRLLTMSNRYMPFWDITCASLRYAVERFELPLDAAGEAQLLNQYRHLSAFPENKPVLTELKKRGVPAGILSNGDPAMLAVAIRSAGFKELLAHVLSVDSVKRFKTDPAAYALGPSALGLPAKDILFVSSNCWDAIGATWYGYTTLWVNRQGAPLEQLHTDPTRVGASLREVLSFFP